MEVLLSKTFNVHIAVLMATLGRRTMIAFAIKELTIFVYACANEIYILQKITHSTPPSNKKKLNTRYVIVDEFSKTYLQNDIVFPQDISAYFD